MMCRRNVRHRASTLTEWARDAANVPAASAVVAGPAVPTATDRLSGPLPTSTLSTNSSNGRPNMMNLFGASQKSVTTPSTANANGSVTRPNGASGGVTLNMNMNMNMNGGVSSNSTAPGEAPQPSADQYRKLNKVCTYVCICGRMYMCLCKQGRYVGCWVYECFSPLIYVPSVHVSGNGLLCRMR